MTTKAILADGLYVPKTYVQQFPAILQAFTYRFEQTVDFGYDNYDENPYLEEFVRMYREVGEYYVFSRGNLEKIQNIFHELEVIDRRTNAPIGIPLEFTGTLKADQKMGLKQFINPNLGGIFVAKPGYGKTVVMNAFVALFQQRCLLLVNKTDLKEQFMKRMRDFTNINELEKKYGQPLMGELSYDKDGNPVDFPITVSTYQLVNYNVQLRLKAIQNRYGLVMVDECHRAPAKCLTLILKYMNPLLFVGMSATPKRKDNYHLLLPDLVGPVRFESALKNDCQVEIIHGEHFPFKNPNINWVTVVNAVAKNPKRNRKIIENVKKDLLLGHRTLVLSDRVNHAKILAEALILDGVKAGCIVGDTKDKDEVLDKLYNLEKAITYLQTETSSADSVDWELVKTWNDFLVVVQDLTLSQEVKNHLSKLYHDRIDCLCASTKLFSEGSDIPCISCLHIVTPTANEVFLEQAIGRIQREYDRKLAPKAVYYADSGCGILYGCSKKVKRICEQVLKYTVTSHDSPVAVGEDPYAI